ncbi:M20/M25/M40 family metallo-hydrolase [Tropicimonas sp. IMCC34043]|uniref:M20/M25/M40 family metallo-hydrolase n=1 Tax=Tropicimonas sp. IMCC34043 TaxID=2248760 RepID=UPI000E269E76|nr:M20/M25/M40 family metallo-hydrolase [Tropicimonas sp. IMCC34043]
MTVEDWLKAHEAEGVAFIEDFVRIESLSADPAYSAEIARAAGFVADALRHAGFPAVEQIPTAGNPCILAEWIVDPAAPTILVYGHYDVQPPDPLDKWLSPPFVPEVRDDRLYGRGVSDDKGPLAIALFVVRAFSEVAGQPPLNIKFLIEGEEESGSPNFEPTVAALKDRLSCDLVVSADGAMWRADLPSVTVASRGLVAFDVTVAGAGKDLHSGRHGGSAPNPIRVLVALLASLHDGEGNVAVPGFAEGATPPDPLIEAAIRSVDFKSGGYFDAIGAPRPDPLPAGTDLLTRQWLVPTLEFNGISGGYAGSGTKTVIPSDATAKITCRLVAGQDPDAVVDAIEAHLRGHLPTGYQLSIARHGPGSAAFALDPDQPGLSLAEDVLEELLGQRPLRVAMGATIPIGAIFARHLGAGTVFFSFSTADEDYHAPNEFFRLSSFRTGLIAWARLLTRLGAMR